MEHQGYQNYEMRPQVDPEAEGEVDPNLYPEARENTKKIQSLKDLKEKMFGTADNELKHIKIFYFFFYSAFGSLFPLMGVYFKQMGLSPSQCGLLVGARPFVEFFSCSFWGKYAERSQKGKTLLLASLFAWIFFTVPIGLIQPPASSCLERVNNTNFMLTTPGRVRAKPPTESLSYGEYLMNYVGLEGQSPLKIDQVLNYQHTAHSKWVVPIFSSVVYRVEDIQRAFLLLFLLVIVGEFFSAPAITLADTAVLHILGDNVDKYGYQRMFGSIGWGISMFIMGIALDNSVSFSNHPCGPEKLERNYIVCFMSFAILMGAALVAATQIKYPDQTIVPANENEIETNIETTTKEDELQDQLALQLNLPSLTVQNKDAQPQLQKNPKDQTKVFAQTTTEMPDWLMVLQQLRDIKCLSVLFVAWFMGFGIGLIFTFLFWHLQDYGGNPTLFGVASIINHVSEIIAYFFSFKLIRKVGHVKVLCLGLVGNIIRFVIISVVKNAVWVLPFELVQGITHAAVWAACCSYLSHNAPPFLRNACQGVLQCLHHGLGRGCGAVIGGFLADSMGTGATFRLYGFCSFLILGVFIFINFYKKDQGFVSNLPDTEDPHQMAEETSHLAPHGVPSNPLPKVLSSTKLNEMNQVQNNYYQQGGDNLSVPDSQAYNPFKQTS